MRHYIFAFTLSLFFMLQANAGLIKTERQDGSQAVLDKPVPTKKGARSEMFVSVPMVIQKSEGQARDSERVFEASATDKSATLTIVQQAAAGSVEKLPLLGPMIGAAAGVVAPPTYEIELIHGNKSYRQSNVRAEQLLAALRRSTNACPLTVTFHRKDSQIINYFFNKCKPGGGGTETPRASKPVAPPDVPRPPGTVP